jgi:glycerol transport system ATP-binding protein
MSLVLTRVGREVAGQPWLTDVSLALAPGTLAVLLGPTGAGKTSLLRVMAGLDRPTTGTLHEGGNDVTRTAPQLRRVAMVYQQFVNYPSLTVFDNLASPLRRQGLGRAEIARRVRETAALVRIEHLLDRLPVQLSGGQQQRCAIARALAKGADLLLLDEPLVNLDYKLREELREELRQLFAGARAIVVYATTEPLEALMMGGEVVVMDEGRVLQHGPGLEVHHRPASRRVAAISSDPPMNMIEGRIEAGRVRLGRSVELPAAGHLAGLAAGAYAFGVRAGHLATGTPRPGEIGIPAEVELAEVSGSETFIHVHHDAVSWVVQAPGVVEAPLGEPVTVRLDPRRLFAFAPEGALRAAPPPPAAA